VVWELGEGNLPPATRSFVAHLPQQLEGDPFAGQFGVDAAEVGKRLFQPDVGLGKEKPVEVDIGQVLGNRPLKSRRLCTLDMLLDCGPGDTVSTGNGVAAEALVLEAEYFLDLSHGQPGFGHSLLLDDLEGDVPRFPISSSVAFK
jgi:hypothetical protein